jgi:NOL1/NOP2/sun family putative RNA methylase
MEKGMKFFLGRYKKLGGAAGQIKQRKSLRVNTLKISEPDLKKRLGKLGVKLEKIPFSKNGYYYTSKFSLGAITEYLLGYLYLQEAAAQLPALVLDPKPGELILDCCAAPGGKTTQMAQLMGNKGVIVAIEKKKHRMTALKTNIERTGTNNVIAYLMDANRLKYWDLKFDKILLDAPCSGNFITDKKWFNKRDLEGVKRSAEIQKSLIKSALSVLKKGGILVYSTCSLEPEENELNMDWMLKHFDVEIEEIDLPIGSRGLSGVFGKRLNKSIANCRRFWPSHTKTQGFFIARIRKL